MSFLVQIYLFVVYNLIAGVDTHQLECDFSRGDGALSDTHVSLCVRRITKRNSLKIICPRDVEGDIDQTTLELDFARLKNFDMSIEFKSFISELEKKGINYNIAEVVPEVEAEREAVEQDDELDGELDENEPEEGAENEAEERAENQNRVKKDPKYFVIPKIEEDIEDRKYAIFPENANEKLKIMVNNELFVKTDLLEVDIKDIFGTRGENIVNKKVEENREVLTIEPPLNDLFSVKEHHPIVYFCIKRKYIDKCDKNVRDLLFNYNAYKYVSGYHKIHIPILDGGNTDIRVGITLVITNGINKIQYGCGNKETRFFKNNHDYELVNGVVHYKLDVMAKPNLGFYCEGNIRPLRCLSSFERTDTHQSYRIDRAMVTLNTDIAYDHAFQRMIYAQANYRTRLLHAPFKGVCECVDMNDRVTAVLELERKTDHVCDISAMLMKNQAKRILGPWCEVTLHPGDTLKIIIPQNIDNINLSKIEKEMGKRPKAKPENVSLKSENGSMVNKMFGYMSYELAPSDSDSTESSNEGDNEGGGNDNAEDEEEEDDDLAFDDAQLDIEDTDSSEEEEEQDEEELDLESIYSLSSLKDLYINTGSAIDSLGKRIDNRIKNTRTWWPEVTYPFITLFSPKKPNLYVNSMKFADRLMTQIRIDDMFGGTAYEVDTSEANKGIYTIEYKKSPLSSKTGKTSVSYFWMLRYRSQRMLDTVAKIKVNLAQVHEYTYGCETIFTGLFRPDLDSAYCRYRFNGCKKTDVNHCAFEVTSTQDYGISCNDDEMLYPNICGEYMIDSSTNRIVNVKSDIKATLFPSLTNYKVFLGSTMSNRTFDYRCSCLNTHGIEMSTLHIYTNNYPGYEHRAYFGDKEYILLIRNVEMLYPERERENRDELELTNTLPEIRHIPVPKAVQMNRLRLECGMFLRITSNAPVIFEKAIPVNPEFESVIMVNSRFRFRGVRHMEPIIKFDLYTDPSLSQRRLFPVNITKYFYTLEKGLRDRLVPVKYSDVFATNVVGMMVKTRNFMGHHMTDYANFALDVPKGAVIIIKKDDTQYVEMMYASGAISKPEKTRRYYETGEEPEIEIDGELVEDRTGVKESDGLDVDDSGESKSYDWEPSTSKESYGRKGGKSLRLMKAQGPAWSRQKRTRKDLRNMEIWGIHSIIVYATNPWVKGCGVMEKGQDFFKPETEKIVENGQVVGCRVNLGKDKIAGFYCPEPYKIYPRSCFEAAYSAIDPEKISILDEVFEHYRWRNTGFRYIGMSSVFKKRIKLMFKNNKTYMCYCKTITGVLMSKIEIVI